MNQLDVSAQPDAILVPAVPAYPRGYVPTEADLEMYYSYDVDLIRVALHNFSSAGIEQKTLKVERDERDTTIHRSESEVLTLSTIRQDQALMLSVSDPRCEDSYYEMTVILLSRREVHLLRTLLNNLAW